MDALTHLVGIATVAVVACAAVLVIAKALTYRYMTHHGYLSDDRAESLRNLLLTAVGEASTEQGMRIALRRFWAAHGVTTAQQWTVLRPLLRSQVLRAASDQGGFARLVEATGAILTRPPGQVILNSRDWWALSAGSAGITVRDVRGSIIQIGDGNRAVQTVEVSPELVRELITALRADAARSVDAGSERAESLADSLEADAARGRWQSIAETVNTILGIVASGASLWLSTAAVLARS